MAGRGEGEQGPATNWQTSLRPAVPWGGCTEKLPRAHTHTHTGATAWEQRLNRLLAYLLYVLCSRACCGTSLLLAVAVAKLEAYSLVQDFAVQSLLLHVGLPRPSVLLVGEGNGVAKPAPGQKRRGEDTEDQERVETAAAAYYGNTLYCTAELNTEYTVNMYEQEGGGRRHQNRKRAAQASILQQHPLQRHDGTAMVP